MRRRRVIVGLVALALVGVCALILWPRGPRPCRATFEQVREGMTFEEVCATVGAPPHDPYEVIRSTSPADYWYGSDTELCVHFDPAGRADRVSVKDFPGESVWSRLRARLDF
jgi:hypothetical protein